MNKEKSIWKSSNSNAKSRIYRTRHRSVTLKSWRAPVVLSPFCYRYISSEDGRLWRVSLPFSWWPSVSLFVSDCLHFISPRRANGDEKARLRVRRWHQSEILASACILCIWAYEHCRHAGAVRRGYSGARFVQNSVHWSRPLFNGDHPDKDGLWSPLFQALLTLYA